MAVFMLVTHKLRQTMFSASSYTSRCSSCTKAGTTWNIRQTLFSIVRGSRRAKSDNLSTFGQVRSRRIMRLWYSNGR